MAQKQCKKLSKWQKQFFQQFQEHFRTHTCGTSVVEGLKNLSGCWKANRRGIIPGRQSPREVDSAYRGLVESWYFRLKLFEADSGDKGRTNSQNCDGDDVFCWMWSVFGTLKFSKTLPVKEWLPGGSERAKKQPCKGWQKQLQRV